MNDYTLSELCRETSLILGLEDVRALQTAASVGGEKVCMLYDEDLDDGVYICIDVGRAREGPDAAQTWRELLALNFELSAERGESFGLESSSGHILFRAFLRAQDLTPQALASEIQYHTSVVRELRQGPLSGMT